MLERGEIDVALTDLSLTYQRTQVNRAQQPLGRIRMTTNLYDVTLMQGLAQGGDFWCTYPLWPNSSLLIFTDGHFINLYHIFM